MRKPKITLSTEEKNMLDKLTCKNKMDCWFWIDDSIGRIRDLEDHNRILNTAEAVILVADGTDNVEEFLEQEEVTLFYNLLNRCLQAYNHQEVFL